MFLCMTTHYVRYTYSCQITLPFNITRHKLRDRKFQILMKFANQRIHALWLMEYYINLFQF